MLDGLFGFNYVLACSVYAIDDLIFCTNMKYFRHRLVFFCNLSVSLSLCLQIPFFFSLFLAYVLYIKCTRKPTTEPFMPIYLQIFNGVFLKVNKATLTMLHRAEPYVTYGYAKIQFYFPPFCKTIPYITSSYFEQINLTFPNLNSFKELIYQRGFGKVSKHKNFYWQIRYWTG